MNLLDRYYARHLAMAVVKIITALSLLVIVIDLLVARGDNISKYQIPWGSVAAYYLSFLPFILFEYHAAAIAVLIAGLMVMGKSAQDNEVTAVLAGGVGLRRLARGPVLVALACVVTAFVFQETAGVAAAKKFRELDEKYFSKAGGHLIRGVSWTQLGDGWTCHVLRYNLRANTGRDVFLHRIRPDQVDEIRAKRIFWDDEPGKWMLEDGRWAVFDPKKDWEVQSVRITQTQAPFTESPEKLFTLDAPPGTKNTIELAADIRRADAMNLDLPAQKVAYHLKFAQPMLCLVMIFLAIPFALRVRRGGVALGFGVSVIIGLAYISLFYICVGLGYISKLPPPAAAWIPTIVFGLLGLELFRRLPT